MPVPVALYREYRPRTFAELVGQEHVSRTLLNAISQGRLAHAYLFTGPRGTGKTSMARILAKALNCPNAVDGQPCGQCPTCETIASGDGVDVIELDAASNRGIEEIRTLRERIRLAPVGGRYKVYVIDEVHMLTTEAFNALLKTLEEPPPNVVFVLCTTEAYRVPPTILSRCQRFDFHRHATTVIAEYLAGLVERLGRLAQPAALRAIARAATGSLRDALSILDQCLAYTHGELTLAEARAILGAVDGERLARLTTALLDGDVGATWHELDELLEQGRDAREMARILGHHFRDLLLFRLAGQAGEATGPLADDPGLLADQAATATEQFLYEAIDTLASGEAELRLASQPRLVLEARLVRLCTARSPSPRRRRDVEAARQDAAAPGAPPLAGTGDRQPSAPVPVGREEPERAQPRPERKLPAPNARAEPAAPPLPEAPPDLDWAAEVLAEPHAEVPAPPSPAPATVARQDAVPSTSTAAVSALLLNRAWLGAVAQLPDMEAGYLAEAAPECTGDAISVWLPEGMDWMADYLASKDTCRRLAAAMAGVLGSELQVTIKVRPRRGLFEGGGNGGAPVNPGSKPAAQARPARSSPEKAPGERLDDDDLREAQLMFRAEEVGKGVLGR
jgi:DNA polymerase-3 subunit gamma/tau